MPVWLQLRQAKVIETQGRSTTYQPGDWVQVGKQLARQWLADGSAYSPFPDVNRVEEPAGTAGIMLFGQVASPPDLGIPVANDAAWELRWDKTLFWDYSVSVKVPLLAVGFQFLDKWQVACPLVDYRHLAQDEEMSEGEKQRTVAVIRDLRVPLYDNRLVFMRRCEDTRRLLEVWDQEGPSRLAFLRALYITKPLLLALPCTWTGQWAPGIRE